MLLGKILIICSFSRELESLRDHKKVLNCAL